MRAVNPKLMAYAFLNRTDPAGQGTENEEAVELLKEHPALAYLDTPLGTRKAFAHAASKGLSVTELTGGQANQKASAEILALFERCFNVKPTLQAAV
jgi:chromosome partitioning protein